jgi:hypothetical protein
MGFIIIIFIIIICIWWNYFELDLRNMFIYISGNMHHRMLNFNPLTLELDI